MKDVGWRRARLLIVGGYHVSKSSSRRFGDIRANTLRTLRGQLGILQRGDITDVQNVSTERSLAEGSWYAFRDFW